MPVLVVSSQKSVVDFGRKHGSDNPGLESTLYEKWLSEVGPMELGKWNAKES